MPCFECLCGIFEAGAVPLEAREGVHQQSLDPRLQACSYSWYPKVISYAYKAKHWSYTWDTPILLVWMMIYILGRKPLNTSHESHQSKRSDDFWQQVSHPGGIEGLLVFALEGRDWRQYRHLGAVLGSPHKSSSSTDTDYAIVWAPVEETLSTEKRRKKQNFLSHVYVNKVLRMTEPLYTSFLIPATQKSAFYSSWDLWSLIVRFVASSGLSFVM